VISCIWLSATRPGKIKPRWSETRVSTDDLENVREFVYTIYISNRCERSRFVTHTRLAIRQCYKNKKCTVVYVPKLSFLIFESCIEARSDGCQTRDETVETKRPSAQRRRCHVHEYRRSINATLLTRRVNYLPELQSWPELFYY